MKQGKNRTRVRLSVLALLLVMVAEVVHAIHGESLSWDEGDHIFSGYEIWKAHDYSYNPEHPPIVKMLGAVPLLGLPLIVPPLQGRFFKTEAYLDGRELLYRNDPAHGGHYTADSLIFRARLPILIFIVTAALLVFAAGSEMFGTTAGLLALFVFCFEPSLLAHGAFVATDMAASCTIFATVYTFWRWIKRPTWQRLLVVGIAAGIALAAKHSTVLLAPILVTLALGELVGRWLNTRHQPDEERALARISVYKAALHLAGALVAITVIGVIVLWAFYGFRYTARPAGLVLTPSLQEYVGPLAGVEARGILLVARLHLLPESWLYGLADVRAMANGMPSYFFGKVYQHGVWFYFPVLFLIKTTLAMLTILALTVYAVARGWLRVKWFEGGRELWFLLAPVTIYLLVAMSSHLNIGARHILPLWVFCCVFAGGGMAALIKQSWHWHWIVGVLLVLHAASSLRAAPNYLSYANEAWGGPSHTYRYLTDSNTDWGQQLIATSAYLREHHIEHCYFAYFVQPFIRFEDYGIPCKPLPTADTLSLTGKDIAIYDVPPILDGTVLISAGTLNGFEFGSSVLNPYESFRGRPHVASIQNGVLVFNGTFAVPLASALSHVQRSYVLLKAGDIPGGLREAQIAEQTAPGEVQTEMSLGNALDAAQRTAEADAAYARAKQRIDTMDPDSREIWLKKLKSHADPIQGGP